MPFPFKNSLFNAQWLRAAGHASAGGADVGECLAAAAAIQEPNIETWRDAWLKLAERVATEAEASLAAGHRESAHTGFLRASNYYRTAYIFLFGPGPDPRLVEAYRRQRHTFEQAIVARSGWGERIAIPYQGRALHGYFFAAPGAAPRPAIILNGGYDSTAEEAYFYSGPAALARGYNVLTFDGPGQGAALVEDGLVFRPDWEAVVAPALDYLKCRAEVDKGRITLMGISFGGYLAPRAASGLDGLAALIADPGQYSLLEETRTRLPGPLGRQLPDGRKFVLDALETILRLRLNHPTKGWAIRRGLWVHGVERPIDYLRLTADYTLAGRAENIECPTIICSAENDEIGATGGKLYDLLKCPRSFMRFKEAEGAGEHCEAGARLLFNQRIFDWLDKTLTAEDRRAA
jgi:pimeloyl-ACP methyl ester carboxylesterase